MKAIGYIIIGVTILIYAVLLLVLHFWCNKTLNEWEDEDKLK